MKIVKRALMLIISLSLVLTCSASIFNAPKNVYAQISALVDIQNASFEQVDVNEALNWVVQKVSGETTFATQNAYEGAQYFQINGGQATLETQNLTQINGERDYVFGVKMISSSQNSTCKISVSTFDAQSQLIATYDSEQAQVKLINSWQDVCVRVPKNESAVGVKIQIAISGEENVGVDAVYGNVDFLTLHNGASISLEKITAAIRFSGYVDKAVFDSLAKKYSDVSAGIMVMLTDKLDMVGEYSIRGFSETSLSPITIPANSWSNPSTAEQDGCYKFNGSLINLGQAQIQVELCARLFVKYTENGQEKYIYSDYSIENNSRSLWSVAVMALADEKTFATYNDTQKQIILAYADNRMPDFENLN